MSLAWSVFADICTGIWRFYCAAIIAFVAWLAYAVIREQLHDRRTDRNRRRADVTEALRLAEIYARVDPIDPAAVERIWARVEDELAQRRRDGWVRP